MTFVKTLAVGTFLVSSLVAGTAFAKGHDNGFGAGLAGDLPPGAVASGVRNDEKGGGSETAYGRTGIPEKKELDMLNNNDAAQTRDENHPSSGSGR